MKKILLTFALVSLSTLWSQAGTITSAGTLTNLTPEGFGSGTDVADLDTAETGQDGFVLFNSVSEGTNISNRPWDENIVDNKPAYIQQLTVLLQTLPAAGQTTTTSLSTERPIIPEELFYPPAMEPKHNSLISRWEPELLRISVFPSSLTTVIAPTGMLPTYVLRTPEASLQIRMSFGMAVWISCSLISLLQ